MLSGLTLMRRSVHTMRSRLFSSTLAAAVAVALSASLAAQAPQGQPPAGAPGAQGAPGERPGGPGAPGGQGAPGGRRGGGRGAMIPMLLETDAFPDGGIVPSKYVSAGANTLPGFKISNVPMGTVSFAVIFH